MTFDPQNPWPKLPDYSEALSQSTSVKSEAEKLRSAVAYLVHLLGGEVSIPDEVNRSFYTDNPMYQVTRVVRTDGTQLYQAWETPAMPLGARTAAAVQLLQQYDKDVEITDGWELERVMWLLTNGTNGHPHHDKMKEAETREAG